MRFTIFLSRTTRSPNPPTHLQHLRTIFDGNLKPVRDRGLDHAVEKEKNLKPLLNLKNLIKQEPSKSLPVSSLIKNESLQLPFRPIEFIRKYPSLLEEFHGSGGFQPHVRLTPEAVELDAEEEQLMNRCSDSFKQQVAKRLLKLLMMTRINKIPLSVVEHLRWDLGLPQNYLNNIVPEFPDYFRVVDNDSLELVCWSTDFAVSVMEKNCAAAKKLVFPVQFSTGFEMDSKYDKWLKEWNSLPYVSPYENASHLPASSDESDRWVVGVLHEILHLLVGKKTEKDNVLVLGDWLGLKSRFKRAMLQHPGIFYLSSKIGTYTVVLREGYKRGALVEDHPVMELRRKYIHLMNTVKEDSKASKVAVKGKSRSKEANGKGGEGKVGEKDGEKSVEEQKQAEEEDASETVSEDDDEEPSRSPRGACKTAAANRRSRDFGQMKMSVKRERWAEKSTQRTRERNPSEVSKRTRMPGGHSDVESSNRRSRSSGSRGRSLTSKKTAV